MFLQRLPRLYLIRADLPIAGTDRLETGRNGPLRGENPSHHRGEAI